MRQSFVILSGRKLFLLLLFLLTLPVPNTFSLIQQLNYAGATTLQLHFMPQAAKLFKNRNGIEFTINGGNTGPGIQALIEGTIDISGAGRFLTAEEKSAGLVEHLIGWDALYVIVHRDNPIETLSRQQLQGIFSGQIQNWQDVGGAERPIMVISSPRGSGMRANVREKVLLSAAITEQEVISPIVHDADRLVAQFPTAISILSASMVDLSMVKVVRVDNVMPSAQSIATGKYAMVKPLLLVTKTSPGEAVKEFIDLAASHEGQQIIAEKFFPVEAGAAAPMPGSRNLRH